jgi:hypothetical protein
MSAALTGASSTHYAPSHARGAAGTELRKSMEAALETPERRDRLEVVAARMTSALRKGAAEDVTIGEPVFQRTWEFLSGLPGRIPVPEIVIETDNSIGLDWQTAPRRILSLTIDDTSSIGYAALVGHEPSYGKMNFTCGTMPRAFRNLWNQLTAPAE